LLRTLCFYSDGAGTGPDARNMRRYFPYRSVGLYRAGWGVRVPDLHSGQSALKVYRPQARQTRSNESVMAG